jgi:CrcB protein
MCWAWRFRGLTWGINVSGCRLIGMLMALINEIWARQRLLWPFLGIGILGGYITFATATLDMGQMVAHNHAGLALAHLRATVVAALVAATNRLGPYPRSLEGAPTRRQS